MERKKEELDKIFSSKNKERGRRLILDLNLTNVLGINNLSNIILCTDLIGIWCQLEVEDIYPFTKVEKEQILCLRELLKYDEIDNYLLYKYFMVTNEELFEADGGDVKIEEHNFLKNIYLEFNERIYSITS